MRVCLGQINTTPGDFAGNLAAMRGGIVLADAQDVDIIVFPELSVPGYLSQDLIYQAEYIDKNLRVVDQILTLSGACRPELHVVFGYIDRNLGAGKPYFNMAMVAAAGQVVGTYKKHLLPFYDVFDEQRYFQPGNDLLTFECRGKRVGITICEDLWNDKGSDDYNYAANPFERYRQSGVEVILALNSSPYVQGKPWQRIKAIAPGTRDDLTVVYVNQRGGQDDLVFDGGSFVLRNGHLLHLCALGRQDSFDIVDTNATANRIAVVDAPHNKAEIIHRSATLYELLVLCLHDYVAKSGFSELVLASSGGVDSAVVCKIACDAVGADRVHAIRLPSIFSSDQAKLDALALHKNLGCWDYEVAIDHQPLISHLNQKFLQHGSKTQNLVTRKLNVGYDTVADENIQARMRDIYVMHFSNAFGAMPLSTGNKTESACGYYTHFDMNFSFAPIKDLYKYQVVDIALAQVEIPKNICRKPPSAELAEGQTDEQSLLPYGILDAITRACIEDYVSSFTAFRGWANQMLAKNRRISMDSDHLQRWLETPAARADFERIVGLIGRMEYKRRQTCPGTKVSKVAFGPGRRFPIVSKWSQVSGEETRPAASAAIKNRTPGACTRVRR